MTIDEAIEKYKLMATKGNIMFPQRPDVAEKSNRDYKQTAEWLEELKWYKSQFTYTEEVVKEMTQQSYNKAIDDFVEYVDEYCLGCGYTDGNYTRVDVIKRCFHSKAEQLKK